MDHQDQKCLIFDYNLLEINSLFTFLSVDMEILIPFSSLYNIRLHLRMHLATLGC